MSEAFMKKQTARRRAAGKPTTRREPGSPLSWWRSRRAAFFNAAAARTLRDALATIAIIDEPSWRQATAGDAAAAIGLALRLHPQRSSATGYDLVMSALAACAADGNEAAALVMALGLRRRAGAGRAEARLATGWLVRCMLVKGPRHLAARDGDRA
jgi:hypothetical protein